MIEPLPAPRLIPPSTLGCHVEAEARQHAVRVLLSRRPSTLTLAFALLCIVLRCDAMRCGTMMLWDQGFLLLHMQTTHVHGGAVATSAAASSLQSTKPADAGRGGGGDGLSKARQAGAPPPSKTGTDSNASKKNSNGNVVALDKMEAGSAARGLSRWSLRRVASEIRGKPLGEIGGRRTGDARGDLPDNARDGGKGEGGGMVAASAASLKRSLKFLPDLLAVASVSKSSRRGPPHTSPPVRERVGLVALAVETLVPFPLLGLDLDP